MTPNQSPAPARGFFLPFSHARIETLCVDIKETRIYYYGAGSRGAGYRVPVSAALNTTEKIEMEISNMLHAYLAAVITLGHFFATHVWPTLRAYILAVSPLVIVAMVFWPLRRSARAKTASVGRHD